MSKPVKKPQKNSNCAHMCTPQPKGNTMKTLTAAALLLPGLLTFAPVALAGQTVYIAGTHPVGSSTVTQHEAALMTGDHSGHVVTVQYPRALAPLIDTTPLDASVAAGVRNTPALQPGDTVYCVSQGCIVAEHVEQTAPAGVTFVNYGDPTNRDGGLIAKLPPAAALLGWTPVKQAPVPAGVTRTDVAYEYDVIADAPDNANPVAWANAIMGAVYTHNTYSRAGYDDAVAAGKTVTTTNPDGSTHVLIKADNLPLTRPLRQLGVDKNLVNGLDRILKPVVDAGYHRNSGVAPTRGLSTYNPKPAQPHKAGTGSTGRHRA